MSKKKRTNAESLEFNSLKEIGLELEAPQDEFSYQPDSGGTADGDIGRVEYGIDIDLDAQGRGTSEIGDSSTIEDSSLPIPGASEWSQEHRLPDEELGENSASEEDGISSSPVAKVSPKDKENPGPKGKQSPRRI